MLENTLLAPQSPLQPGGVGREPVQLAQVSIHITEVLVPALLQRKSSGSAADREERRGARRTSIANSWRKRAAKMSSHSAMSSVTQSGSRYLPGSAHDGSARFGRRRRRRMLCTHIASVTICSDIPRSVRHIASTMRV